jgi:hypothetical protein
MTSFADLARIDAQLASAGHHALTPWWREQMERFYAHPTARTFVGRVGRGGVKSHTSAKVALSETLFGDWRIPPGERHYWAFVSRTKDEATQRLLLLQSFLRALGVPFDVSGDEIALRDMPRGFRVFACQIGAVSGFRCFGYSADELAKWTAGLDAANPAAEVCASLNAMCATHRGIRRLLISSPMGLLDHQAERFALGDTDDQIVARATTWISNPSISEDETRRLEPNERIWRREYAAIPQAGGASVFDLDAINRAFANDRQFLLSGEPVLIVDPSSGRKDAWTWCVARWVSPPTEPPPQPLVQRGHYVTGDDGRQQYRSETFMQLPNGEWVAWRPKKSEAFLLIEDVDGVEGKFFGDVSADDIVSRLATLCRRRRIRKVHADQREEYALASLFRKAELSYHSHPYTASSKPDAVAQVRSWLRDRRIALPNHDKMRRELLEFEERITPSGTFTFGARGSGHDDYACLLLTAALADVDGALRDSPYRHGSRKAEIAPGQRPLIEG